MTYRLTAGCSTAELLRNKFNSGNVLLSQGLASQVPSAQEGLTTVFEMGTGGTPPP